MLIQMTADQLRAALKDIEEAENAGFMHCEAVFDGNRVDGTWVKAKYSDLWEKAHPTNGSLNWGRNQDIRKRYTFKDGKLHRTKEAQKEIDEFPRSVSIESGTINGYEYHIVDMSDRIHRMEESGNAYNGYVISPKRPVIEEGYHGILTYVPVHGGITYAEQKKVGMVYGFDTLHCNSHEFPRGDKEWIKGEIKKMIDGILMAAKVEKKYLTAKTNQSKAKYAQMVLDTEKEKKNQYNMGVGINLLCQKL